MQAKEIGREKKAHNLYRGQLGWIAECVSTVTSMQSASEAFQALSKMYWEKVLDSDAGWICNMAKETLV